MPPYRLPADGQKEAQQSTDRAAVVKPAGGTPGSGDDTRAGLRVTVIRVDKNHNDGA